jgi:hypothetical protein
MTVTAVATFFICSINPGRLSTSAPDPRQWIMSQQTARLNLERG